MRLLRALAPALSAFVLSGCGYVHFGRLPVAAGDSAEMQRAYADLTLQQKILKQELELAYKESETLRTALERTAAGGAAQGSDSARQLEATARELADLRSKYSRLQAERTSAPATDTSGKTNAALQAENAKLTKELDAARSENAVLAEKLKTSVAENQQAQSAIEELSTDLQSQRRARERAEQATSALRAQLEAVMSRTPPAPNRAAGDQPIDLSTSAPTSALSLAKAPPSDAAPTAELRTSIARLRAAAATNASTSTSTETESAQPASASPAVAPSPQQRPATPATAPSAQPPAPAGRTYTVQAGDTLEKIASRVYGAADQWGKIYAANAELLTSRQGLKPGMELQIP